MSGVSDYGDNAVRDDRSNGDTLSVTSFEDDIVYEGHTFTKERFSKQKRRGSGLAGIASFFKTGVRGGHKSKDHAKDAHKNSGAAIAAEDVTPLGDSCSTLNSEKSETSATITVSERSPREFLDVMWRSRGYSRELYNTLETGYFNEPSPLQVASYHSRVVELVREDDLTGIRTLLETGISQNPSSPHNGVSLLHEACRLPSPSMLRVFVEEFGADVRISDNSGKTPLHLACVGQKETPTFAIVDILATKDQRMFSLKDMDGKTPLDYIPVEHWGAWIDFLYIRRDQYWPRRLLRIDGPEAPPKLTQQNPNSRPLPDPVSAMSIDLVGLLVSGEISVEDAASQKKESEIEALSTISAEA